MHIWNLNTEILFGIWMLFIALLFTNRKWVYLIIYKTESSSSYHCRCLENKNNFYTFFFLHSLSFRKALTKITLSLHLPEKGALFLIRSVVKTDFLDCHCMVGGVVIEGARGQRKGMWVYKAKGEQKLRMGVGGDYWPPEWETKSHHHRKQRLNLSASSPARCCALTEHMSMVQLKSWAVTYKELH